MQTPEFRHLESSIYLKKTQIHCSKAQTHGSGGRTAQGISCHRWAAAVRCGFLRPPERPCLEGARPGWELPRLRGVAGNPTFTAVRSAQRQHEAGLGETLRARRRIFHHGWIFPREI